MRLLIALCAAGALTPCRGGRIFAAKKRDGRHERSDFGGRTDWTGFLGRLAFLSGANITYVDKNENIVEALSDRGDYQIDFFGRQRQALCIRGYEALHLQHPAAAKRVAEADLVMTSVLAENLAGIVPLLERALFLRGLLPPILVCENGIRPSAKLRDALPKSVRISDAVLLCTTCAHGLDISSQDLDFLPYDAAGFDIPAGLYGSLLNMIIRCCAGERRIRTTV